MSKSLLPILQTLCGAMGARGRHLTRREAREAFELLLDGEGTPAQVSALFVAIRSHGAIADELVGCAEASRARLKFPRVTPDTVVIATSRTGKRYSPPMGLASALAAAAAGVPILLQVMPSAAGSGVTLGDLWRHLAGDLTSDADHATTCLRSHRIACWSPVQADPAWERLLGIEEEIQLRSAPDVVTKLLAPEACRLMVAAMPGPVLGTAGDALAMLGHTSAMIVQGVEGSVDPYVSQMTRGMLIEEGGKSPLRIQPEDLALFGMDEANFMHEEPLEAAVGALMEALLCTPGPNLDTSLLGAAMLIRLAGHARDLASAAGKAREALESGKAHHLFEAVRAGA